MELDPRTTDRRAPADLDLALHLLGVEAELLRPEVRRSRAALEALLAPDFVEIGSSGRVYDREAIVAALADEAPATVRIEEFRVRLLAVGIALATYRSVREDPGSAAVARRSSIWRRDGDRWRMTFHQGTPSR